MSRYKPYRQTDRQLLHTRRANGIALPQGEKKARVRLIWDGVSMNHCHQMLKAASSSTETSLFARWRQLAAIVHALLIALL